jgi:hypothetical protein
MQLVLALLYSVVSASPSAAADGLPVEALQRISGNWKIVSDTGEIQQDCAQGQNFSLSKDGLNIDLTEPWADPPFFARYRIVVTEPGRILTLIDGEKRRTETGNPLLWWFHFEDADHFRFRRYDWGAHNATDTRWERCPVSDGR